jgi:hypothetical protein
MHRGLPGFAAELELSKVSDGGGSSAPAATNFSSRDSFPIECKNEMQIQLDAYDKGNEVFMQDMKYTLTCCLFSTQYA